MLNTKDSSTALSCENPTIHVAMDISASGIRYAIGRKISNRKIEILGINTHHLEILSSNVSTLLSTLEGIKEEALMEFALQIQVVHLCVSANVGDTLSDNCSGSLFQLFGLADLEIDRIDLVGNAASEAVMLDVERETSCMFLEIRNNGTHIHFYNRRVVSQCFLAHHGLFSDAGQVDLLALLEQVKKIAHDYSFNKVVITGEIANNPRLLSLAGVIFSMPCRIGKPNLYVKRTVDMVNHFNFRKMKESPEYSAVIGLLLRAL